MGAFFLQTSAVRLISTLALLIISLSQLLLLLYIVVVLCVVIGQLHANKCDNHAMCR